MMKVLATSACVPLGTCGLTDKRLVGADGGEGEIAHPPPDDQGQDDVHRTKHAHQDKTYLHEVVSASDIADLIM